jgi:hypothetical protein
VGKVIEEQVALFGTLTGETTPAAREPAADILPLPRRRASGE